MMGILPLGLALWFAAGDNTSQLTIIAHATPLPLEVRLISGIAYVPMTPLVEELNIEVKRIGEEQLGICPTQDLCVLVRTDGSDDRIAVLSGETFIALSAIPELFQMAFAWSASQGAFELIPGQKNGVLHLSPGDPFPDLVLPDMDGNAFSFASLRGRKTVLFTWASW